MELNYKSLGKNIKKYRHISGMRQYDLAEKCDCCDSHLGQIENGNNTPSLELLVKIANALSVTVDQLLADSYSHPEQVYLKDISERIEKYPLPKRIVICEMLAHLLDSIDKVYS